jgi:hypothetical protein
MSELGLTAIVPIDPDIVVNVPLETKLKVVKNYHQQ